MKLSIPETFSTPFAMLMKALPEELQGDEEFKDTALVYLKFGGIRLARQYVETRKRFLYFDPLETDTGFRFPRLQEVETEEGAENENSDDNDQNSDEKSQETTEEEKPKAED